MADQLATKGEFARSIGISPSRLSHMIDEGLLRGALVGQGNRALIDVAKARECLGDRLADLRTSQADLEALGDLDGTIEQQRRRLQLKAAQRADRQAEADELLRAGTLESVEDGIRRTTEAARRFLVALQGWAPRLAQELGAAFPAVSTRELQHKIDKAMKAFLTEFADQAERDAAAMPQLVKFETTTGEIVVDAGDDYASDYANKGE